MHEIVWTLYICLDMLRIKKEQHTRHTGSILRLVSAFGPWPSSRRHRLKLTNFGALPVVRASTIISTVETATEDVPLVQQDNLMMIGRVGTG